MKKVKAILKKLVGRAPAGDQTPPLESYPNAPDLFRNYRSFVHRPGLIRRPGGWEYKGRFYQDYLTVGGASFAIFRTAQNFCSGNGLDIGAGLWPFPGSTPVDIWRGAGAGRTLEEFADESQDYLFSSHCLEHVEAWEQELDKWSRKVKVGGVIFLYLPHPDCGIWNPGSPMVGNEHKWQPESTVVKQALVQRGFSIIASDEGPDAMMSFFVCARKESSCVVHPPDR
jgi:hypothetical protein